MNEKYGFWLTFIWKISRYVGGNCWNSGNNFSDFSQFFSNFLIFQWATFQHFTSTIGTGREQRPRWRLICDTQLSWVSQMRRHLGLCSPKIVSESQSKCVPVWCSSLPVWCSLLPAWWSLSPAWCSSLLYKGRWLVLTAHSLNNCNQIPFHDLNQLIVTLPVVAYITEILFRIS